MKHISWARHCARCKETESFSKKLIAWWGRQTCSELENGVALDTNPGKRHKAGKGRKKEGRGEDDHCITGTQKGLDLTHCGKQEVPSWTVLQVTGIEECHSHIRRGFERCTKSLDFILYIREEPRKVLMGSVRLDWLWGSEMALCRHCGGIEEAGHREQMRPRGGKR